MLVAHRGGGAPDLTAEQVKICAFMYPPWVTDLSTVEAVEIGETCALLEAGADLRPWELDPGCRGVVRDSDREDAVEK